MISLVCMVFGVHGMCGGVASMVAIVLSTSARTSIHRLPLLPPHLGPIFY